MIVLEQSTVERAPVRFVRVELEKCTDPLVCVSGFSSILRTRLMNLDFAVEQLRLLRQEGQPLTISALNAILSGAAECGNVDRVLALWHEFERNDLAPNSDSYSFVFESLGKNLRRAMQKKRWANQDHVDACLVTADSFLAKMEEQGLAPTYHIVREYIELLCIVGQVDTATAIVLDSIEKGEGNLIGDKSIYRVAMANAKLLQQFDVARKVATCRPNGEDVLEFLLSNIAREERLALGIHATDDVGERDYGDV